MEAFFKAAAIGMICCIFSLVLQRSSREQAMLLNTLSVTMLLASFLQFSKPVMDTMHQLESQIDLESSLISPVYKCLGIGIVSQTASGICKDAGSSAVSESIRMLGTAAGLYCASPLFLAVLSLVKDLMGG